MRGVRNLMARSDWGLDTPTRDGDGWWHRARCKEVPGLMFPGRNDPTGNWSAKKFCHGCPARQQCLEDALARGRQLGVWGGMSEIERERIHRGMQQRQCDRCGMSIVPAARQRFCHACGYRYREHRPVKPPVKPSREASRKPARGYQRRKPWRPDGPPQKPAHHHDRIVALRSEGLSWREIAQEIGASEEATKSHFFRLRRGRRLAGGAR